MEENTEKKDDNKFKSFLKKVGLVVFGALAAFGVWVINNFFKSKNQTPDNSNLEEEIKKSKVEVKETLEKVEEKVEEISKIEQKAEEVLNTNTTEERLNNLESLGVIRRKNK